MVVCMDEGSNRKEWETVAPERDNERAASGNLNGDKLNGRQSTSSPSCFRNCSVHGTVELSLISRPSKRLKVDSGS